MNEADRNEWIKVIAMIVIALVVSVIMAKVLWF